MAVVARVWIELSDLYRVHDTRTHIKRLNMYFAASVTYSSHLYFLYIQYIIQH